MSPSQITLFGPASARGEASIKIVVVSETALPQEVLFAWFGVTVTVMKTGPASVGVETYCAFKEFPFRTVQRPPPALFHSTSSNSVAVADKLAVPF